MPNLLSFIHTITSTEFFLFDDRPNIEQINDDGELIKVFNMAIRSVNGQDANVEHFVPTRELSITPEHKLIFTA